MHLHYSIKELRQIEERVQRSIEALETNGTLISGEHSLSIIKKLIEESKQLRDELIRKNTHESS